MQINSTTDKIQHHNPTSFERVDLSWLNNSRAKFFLAISVPCLLLIISYIVMNIIKRFSKSLKKSIPTLYDDCAEGLERYTYLVTISFGPCTNTYKPETQIVIEFLTTQAIWLTRLVITPTEKMVKKIKKCLTRTDDFFTGDNNSNTSRSSWTENSFNNFTITCELVLCRLTPLVDFGAIRLSHDCFQPSAYIVVTQVRVESLSTRQLWSFPIKSFIGYLGPMASMENQMFRLRQTAIKSTCTSELHSSNMKQKSRQGKIVGPKQSIDTHSDINNTTAIHVHVPILTHLSLALTDLSTSKIIFLFYLLLILPMLIPLMEPLKMLQSFKIYSKNELDIPFADKLIIGSFGGLAAGFLLILIVFILLSFICINEMMMFCKNTCKCLCNYCHFYCCTNQQLSLSQMEAFSSRMANFNNRRKQVRSSGSFPNEQTVRLADLLGLDSQLAIMGTRNCALVVLVLCMIFGSIVSLIVMMSIVSIDYSKFDLSAFIMSYFLAFVICFLSSALLLYFAVVRCKQFKSYLDDLANKNNQQQQPYCNRETKFASKTLDSFAPVANYENFLQLIKYVRQKMHLKLHHLDNRGRSKSVASFISKSQMT